MNNNIFRYRVITNLQCTNRCSFCYQTYKPAKGTDIILSIDTMINTMNKVYTKRGKLKRATFMGGESLLLPNISEYIKVAKNKYAETICLVTNGVLITEDLIKQLANSNLDEIAISIYSLENYNNMKHKLELASKYIPNMRINIPRCEESSNDNLKILIEKCLDDNFGCVVCEDLMGRYGAPHDEVISKWDNIIELSNEYNFITYLDKQRNKKFGLFAHYSGYNNTDVIITPFGNFSSWEMYCKKIGNTNLM